MAAAALSEIAQVTNVVHDIDRAVKFHRDVLGLPLLFQAPTSLAFFQCGSVRLMLSPPENPEQDHPGSFLYFRVQDIESDDSPTACGQHRLPSQRYPGTEDYDTLTYRNFGSTSSRVTVYMTGPSATQFVWASAYLDSFDTADGFPNVIGWEGLPAGCTERFQQFSFDVPAGHTSFTLG